MATARRTLAETEKTQAEATAERNAAQEHLKISEQKVRDLEGRLDEEGRESTDMAMLRQRLAEELEDEREQHHKDIAERDFTVDQTRKKYQGMSLFLCIQIECYVPMIFAFTLAELAQLSEGKAYFFVVCYITDVSISRAPVPAR